MKTLAFMQNQWFKDPARVRAMYARHPEMRNDFIRRFLFAGCRSGQVLERAFGREFCHTAIWEEASPEIGGHAGSVFGYDAEHIAKALLEHRPGLVLAFGRIAVRGVYEAMTVLMRQDKSIKFELVCGPHPAARGPGTVKELMTMSYGVGKMLCR